MRLWRRHRLHKTGWSEEQDLLTLGDILLAVVVSRLRSLRRIQDHLAPPTMTIVALVCMTDNGRLGKTSWICQWIGGDAAFQTWTHGQASSSVATCNHPKKTRWFLWNTYHVPSGRDSITGSLRGGGTFTTCGDPVTSRARLSVSVCGVAHLPCIN